MLRCAFCRLPLQLRPGAEPILPQEPWFAVCQPCYDHQEAVWWATGGPGRWRDEIRRQYAEFDNLREWIKLRRPLLDDEDRSAIADAVRRAIFEEPGATAAAHDAHRKPVPQPYPRGGSLLGQAAEALCVRCLVELRHSGVRPDVSLPEEKIHRDRRVFEVLQWFWNPSAN